MPMSNIKAPIMMLTLVTAPDAFKVELLILHHFFGNFLSHNHQLKLNTWVAAAHSMLAGSFIEKMYLESLGKDPDQPLTIPIGINSSSAITMSESNRDIK
jgi:hypothetical protein